MAGIPDGEGGFINPDDSSSGSDDEDGGGSSPTDEEILETIRENTGGHGLGAGPVSQGSGRGGSAPAPGTGFGAGTSSSGDGRDDGGSTPGDQPGGDRDRDRATPGANERTRGGSRSQPPGAGPATIDPAEAKRSRERSRGPRDRDQPPGAGPATIDPDEARERAQSTQATRTGQGIELGNSDVPREIIDQAQELEQRIIESNPGLDEDDVGIFYDEETGQLIPTLSDIGERKQETESRNQRSEVADDLEEQLEEQTGLDVEPGEDFVVVDEGDGSFRAEPTDQLIERLQAEAARRQGVAAELIPDREIRGAPQTPEGRIDAQLEAELGVELDRGEDYRIETSTNEEGETVYRAELTRSGQRKAAGDEFEDEVEGPFEVLPTVDDEDATLEDVLGGTSDAIRRGADELAETTDVINPIVLGGRTARLARERGPFGFTGYDVLLADDEADEGTIEEQGEALAAGVYELPAYVVDTVRAGEELREFGLAVGERAVETTRLEERPEATVGPTGRRPTHRIRSEAPGLVAEETIETTEEAGGAIVKSVETPTGRARLAGGLVGTALVMGGAGAISGRAGAATRFAIQPGEELLTVGATRAAPGVARKFPNNRIDNEEIVLRELARGGRRIATGARRLRSRIEGEEAYSPGGVMQARDRGQLSLVDLLPGGETEVETRTEPELDEPTPVIGGEDIPPSIEAWRTRIGPSSEDVGGRFNVERNPMRERAREATRRSVETETEVEEELGRARRAAELTVLGAATSASAATTAGAIERLDLAQEAEAEGEFETELEAELEAEAERELALEAAIESELELEAETEAEAETELDVELEAEADQESDQEGEGGLDAAPFGEPGEAADDLLAPGWVSETITDIALGARTRERAAPQELLEAAPIEQRALGELPTYEELLGTEEEREAIEETRALLSGAPGDVDEGASMAADEFGAGLELDPAAFDLLDEDVDVDDQGGGLL